MSNLKTVADLDAHRFKSGVVEKMVGVPSHTLRIWETDLGMEVPRAASTGAVRTGYRNYTIDNIFDFANKRRNSSSFDGLGIGEQQGPIVIACYVIKGGTAKSTTVIETATQLQLMGYKTLIIDLDQQGNVSFMCGLEPELEEDTAAELGFDQSLVIKYSFQNLFDIPPFFDKKTHGSPNQTYATFDEVVKKPFGENGVHIIPADVSLVHFNFALNSASNREKKIQSLIDSGRSGKNPDFDISKYDFIFFDCPPTVSLTVRAALVAADLVIAPFKLDELSKKGLSLLSTELTIVGEDFNSRPPVLITPTFYTGHVNRMSAMLEWAQETYGAKITHAIRQSEELPKNLATHMPLSLTNPTAPVVLEDYRKLAKSVVEAAQSLRARTVTGAVS